MARWRHTAAAVMLSWGLVACSGQDQAAEQAKAEEAKKQALATKKADVGAYFGSVNEVSSRLEEFKKALQEVQTSCREQCDIEAHKEAFTTKVLPSFETLLTSLEGMPTKNKELEKIHGKLVKAYRHSGAMLAKYPKELTVQNKEKRLVAYIQDLSVTISDVEKVYNQELKAYCSSEPKVDCDVSTKD